MLEEECVCVWGGGVGGVSKESNGKMRGRGDKGKSKK